METTYSIYEIIHMGNYKSYQYSAKVGDVDVIIVNYDKDKNSLTLIVNDPKKINAFVIQAGVAKFMDYEKLKDLDYTRSNRVHIPNRHILSTQIYPLLGLGIRSDKKADNQYIDIECFIKDV